MIKATSATGDGRPMVWLGLTGENMTRLMADEPIAVDLAGMGLPPMVVVLVGGRTEREIIAQFESQGMVPPGSAAALPEPDPGKTHVVIPTWRKRPRG